MLKMKKNCLFFIKTKEKALKRADYYILEIKYNNLIKVICDICNSYENVLYHDNMENIFCQ
jgi:hypothetical protein|nr:MAG TPA: hypothetical protein [Caudoviricetes sp.]